MQVTVTFRHMDATEALKEYAEEKLGRLQKYADTPMDVHVVLYPEKFLHVAEISTTIRGTPMLGSERTEDMYASIDAAVDKLERQVVKHKERIQRR